jgi:putative drug exporter of the RND superfamily
VRMLLVPALMQLIGRANWWIPAWLDRALPRFSPEAPPAR